jgi:hypothetical protein
LLDVVGIGPDQEITAGFSPGEAPIPLKENVKGVEVTLLVPTGQVLVTYIGERPALSAKRHEDPLFCCDVVVW